MALKEDKLKNLKYVLEDAGNYLKQKFRDKDITNDYSATDVKSSADEKAE